MSHRDESGRTVTVAADDLAAILSIDCHIPRSQCSCEECCARLRLCAALDAALPPATGSPEPLGSCFIHGDYWTDDCLRCGR